MGQVCVERSRSEGQVCALNGAGQWSRFASCCSFSSSTLWWSPGIVHLYIDRCMDSLGLGGWDCTYDFSSITLQHGQPYFLFRHLPPFVEGRYCCARACRG